MGSNGFKDVFNLSKDFVVCKAKDSKTKSFKFISPAFVFFRNFRDVVNTAVNFNNQFALMTVKINYKNINRMLIPEFESIDLSLTEF